MKTIFDFPLDRIRRKPLRFVSTSTGTEYINDERVKPGELQIITRLAVENLNNTMTRFRICVWDGANLHFLAEQKSSSAATLYAFVDPIYLSEGENLRIELVGASVGDVTNVYVDGFLKCGNSRLE